MNYSEIRQIISISEPLPNSNKNLSVIELGFNDKVVVPHEMFKVNELVVWIPEGMKIDKSMIQFSNMKKTVVKCRKILGIISNGIIKKLNDFDIKSPSIYQNINKTIGTSPLVSYINKLQKVSRLPETSLVVYEKNDQLELKISKSIRFLENDKDKVELILNGLVEALNKSALELQIIPQGFKSGILSRNGSYTFFDSYGKIEPISSKYKWLFDSDLFNVIRSIKIKDDLYFSCIGRIGEKVSTIFPTSIYNITSDKLYSPRTWFDDSLCLPRFIIKKMNTKKTIGTSSELLLTSIEEKNETIKKGDLSDPMMTFIKSFGYSGLKISPTKTKAMVGKNSDIFLSYFLSSAGTGRL